MKVDGGCHCGAIAYEAEIDPAQVLVCHCADCQATSGSPFRVGVPAPAATFRLLHGSPKTYIKTTADSGRRRLQAFCGDCGSPIYSAAEHDTPSYTLRVGTIRQRAELRPRRQKWCRSSLPWAMNLESLPKAERE